MKYLWYIWSVFVAILTIYIVYSLLDLFYDDFEILTTSILILIYVSINSLGISIGKILESMTLWLSGEFKKVRALLNSDYYDEEIEDEKIDQIKQTTKDNNFNFYVKIVTNLIIYVMVVIKIFNIIQ